MKKSASTIFTLVGLLFLCTATTQAFQVITQDIVKREMVTKTDLIKTADNFIVLFDTSGSTNEMVPGKNVTKIAATKALLKERNEWFPDLGYQAGLYIYTSNETLSGTFKAIYPMQAYDRDRFGAAIDQLPEKGQGPTMVQSGFHALRKVVSGLRGKTVVFIYTDGSGTVMRNFKQPIQIAQEIAKDNDICFYLISSANDADNKRLLASVAKVNACSRVIPLATFIDNPLYLAGALFTVKTSSYERLTPVTKVVGVQTEDVLFDFNGAEIRSEYTAGIDKLGDYLLGNPDAYVVAAGFADSTGDEEYNLALSERRAVAVKDYMVKKFSIGADRIVTLWFGEINPVADNATEEGRQRNRRVEIAVGGVQ
ncbi:MAG: OmpA family protein [Deltaproteobacteria bacterium]|nr:OmpA family protein [Deltaproteobacteria bacterium]